MNIFNGNEPFSAWIMESVWRPDYGNISYGIIFSWITEGVSVYGVITKGNITNL